MKDSQFLIDTIPVLERSSTEEIKIFQEAKLKELLRYLNENSRYYKKKFSELNIDIDAVNCLDDLIKLPITTKDDIQQNNEDFFCVDRTRIVDYVTTSGSLGDPVVFPLTANDLDRLAHNEYLSLLCTQDGSHEVYQITTTLDRRFMAGMAYFLGARELKSGVVRVGPGIPELQWDTIVKIKPTALIAVPSFLLAMIDYAEKNGIDYKASSVKKAICVGEPIRNLDFSYNTLGQKIHDRWNIDLFSTYASTEMVSAFTECEAGKGGHHHPELIICEFLDDNDQPVGDGEAGELTITTLGIEGMPLLRFKTGDICKPFFEPCSCGRTTMRISPIIGRKKQMIKYRGTSLYPPALYDILDNTKGVINYVVEVFLNELGTDEIVIKIGSDDTSEKFEKSIKDHFRAKLRVAPSVQFINWQEIKVMQLPEMSRKPIKFFDKR
jgi:phenylacetate-CoA ligase